MLTLVASQPESLWDESLPVEVKQPPADLAALDVLLCGHELLWPIVERWQREFEQTGRRVLTEGRPTIAIETYVRLMVLKQRYRWGYRTLVAEVSDSIHLRRFCRIGLGERVPDESTVRKLTRRIGSGGEDRLDRDRGGCEVPHRCGAGVQRRAGVGAGGAQAGEVIKDKRARVRDRSRSMGRKLRAITRTIRRRTGEAKTEVLKLTAETGELLASVVGAATRSRRRTSASG
jgi:IS5 family transposase